MEQDGMPIAFRDTGHHPHGRQKVPLGAACPLQTGDGIIISFLLFVTSAPA